MAHSLISHQLNTPNARSSRTFSSATHCLLTRCNSFVATSCSCSNADVVEDLNACKRDSNDCRLLCISARSEEHTSELQSLMRISYAVFCLKKKTYTTRY